MALQLCYKGYPQTASITKNASLLQSNSTAFKTILRYSRAVSTVSHAMVHVICSCKTTHHLQEIMGLS